MGKKKKGRITVLEAVDTLSHLADLDVEKPEKVEWLDPNKVEENQAVIRETFQAINGYLQHMYHKDRNELNRPSTQRGIKAMMQLAGEAVHKVGQYTELFQGAHAKEATISEFKKLQKFYLSKVFTKLQKESLEEPWEVEGVQDDEKRQVLKDLDTVRHDLLYDLFYITHDDGTPFYTSNLLRHLRMVGNFDETFVSTEREDFMSKIDVALDRHLHLSAQKVLEECSDLIDLFYKEAYKHKESQKLMETSKGVMALLLAANPKNLRHNSPGKCSMDYWNDFVIYLRTALASEAPKSGALEKTTQKLLHKMCLTLFLKTGTRQDHIVADFVEKKLDPAHSMWHTLGQTYEKLQEELQKYPSGPLMKILQMFRKEEEKMGFDPMLQKNVPGLFFTLTNDELHTTVMHMAAPIHQITIERGEVTEEFKGYLRSLGEKKHLYINLQDRTSWRENLRCTLLEDLSKTGEFSPNFHLMTLPKDTDFYHQLKHFSEVSDSQQFLTSCVEQIAAGAENGFYFPKSPKKWLEPLVRLIFTEFFQAPAQLDRKQRLDFIEILYFFITLMVVEMEKPDVLNFSCKDGIDAGAGASSAFYGFTRMLSTKSAWTASDRDAFIYSLILPALFTRHRLIDLRRIQRTLSALEHFELALKAHRSSILKACADFLPDVSFKISEVA